MIKKVLILGGGISRERLISLETARSVYNSLKKKIIKFPFVNQMLIYQKQLEILNQMLFLMHYTDSLVKMVIFKQFLNLKK